MKGGAKGGVGAWLCTLRLKTLDFTLKCSKVTFHHAGPVYIYGPLPLPGGGGITFTNLLFIYFLELSFFVFRLFSFSLEGIHSREN